VRRLSSEADRELQAALIWLLTAAQHSRLKVAQRSLANPPAHDSGYRPGRSINWTDGNKGI
jgi:hypothetical protein